MATAEQIVDVPLAPQEALAQAYSSLAMLPRLKGPPAYVSPGPGMPPTAIEARTGTTMRTWGNKVQVVVIAIPDGSRLRISSSSFQLIDWGRGKDEVAAVIAGLGPTRPAV